MKGRPLDAPMRRCDYEMESIRPFYHSNYSTDLIWLSIALESAAVESVVRGEHRSQSLQYI